MHLQEDFAWNFYLSAVSASHWIVSHKIPKRSFDRLLKPKIEIAKAFNCKQLLKYDGENCVGTSEIIVHVFSCTVTFICSFWCTIHSFLVAVATGARNPSLRAFSAVLCFNYGHLKLKCFIFYFTWKIAFEYQVAGYNSIGRLHRFYDMSIIYLRSPLKASDVTKLSLFQEDLSSSKNIIKINWKLLWSNLFLQENYNHNLNMKQRKIWFQKKYFFIFYLRFIIWLLIAQILNFELLWHMIFPNIVVWHLNHMKYECVKNNFLITQSSILHCYNGSQKP